MQTTVQNITPAANLFTNAAASMPTPVCVTAFIATQSLASLDYYADGTATITEPKEIIVSVGTYMSDRSIWHICNFTNAANALNYAFMLKGENCPISKNAFAFLQAEIKRTGAVSTRAQKKAEAEKANVEEKKADKEKADAEVIKLPKPKNSASVAVAPLMKQYEVMKKKHPDALILFRVGDFYETFSDDAVAAAEILNITLIRRANGKSSTIELAGFPNHALDTYLPKLVRAGKRVVICEQFDEPNKAPKKAE